MSTIFKNVYKHNSNVLFKEKGEKLILMDLQVDDRVFEIDGLSRKIFLHIDGVKTLEAIVMALAAEKGFSEENRQRFLKDSTDFAEDLLKRKWIVLKGS